MATGRVWSRWLVVVGLVALVVILRLTVFAPQVLPVRVVAVEKGRVEETVTNSRAGTVKARRRAKLAPEIGGRVLELPRRRGARVKKGELLLRVDDALQKAQLRLSEDERKAALAQRDQACLIDERSVRERDRTRSLATQGIVSTDLIDSVDSQARNAEAACRAARATAERADSAVALARAQLDKTVLRAPFDGVVADTFIELGEWTAPSPPALPIPPVLDLIDTALDLRERADGRGRLRPRPQGPGRARQRRLAAGQALPRAGRRGGALRARPPGAEPHASRSSSSSTTTRWPPACCRAPLPTSR